MNITIYDIAKKLGYTPATVSKALNNKSDISKKTRELIQKAAKEMGYSPNSQAVALSTKKTWNIGIVSVDAHHSGLTHYMFSQVLNSIKDQAETYGYDVTFISENIGGKETSYLEHAKYRRCDGVIVACIDFQSPSVHELIGSSLPVVVIDHDFEKCGVISSDNIDGMKKIVDYLHQKGFRDLLYIHGEPCDVTTHRVQSFIDRCKELDISNAKTLEGIYYSKSSSYKKTKEYFENNKLIPTAIIYPDDYSAIGGIRALKELGYMVPSDIAVVGYDGIELGALIEPSLTTVKQDTNQIGIEAVNTLIDLIENKSKDNRQVIVPVEFIERNSTK